MGKSGKGSGNWLMTYADFITLMMIFFIVLYTFTPGVEKNKFTAIIGAFQGKTGVLQFESVFSDEMLQVDVQRAKNWDRIYQMIIEENLEDRVKIELMPDGIKITLGEAALFETYSTELRQDALPLLGEIASAIRDYTDEDVEVIDVQGHTDNRPVIPGGRRYITNWELGSGRALSVMEFLKIHTGLLPEQYAVTSFGEYRPIAPNDSPGNMQKNRRVEVLIRYKQKSADLNPNME